MDPVMRQPQEENKGKENNFFENTADGSPVMTSAEVCSTKKKIRKRNERRHNTTESNGNLSRVPKDTFSTETSAAALVFSPQNPAQHSVDPVMRQSQVENAAKEKNVLKNPIDESPAMTSADVSLRKKGAKKSRWDERPNAVECNGNLFGVPKVIVLAETSAAFVVPPLQPDQNSVDPLMRQSQVENATMEKHVLGNASDGSPAMTSAKECLGKNEKRKRRRERRREISRNLSGAPKEAFSTEISTSELAMPPQPSAQNSLDPVMRQSQVENAAKEKNVLKNPIDESPAMTSAEVSLRKKDAKKSRWDERPNAIECNGNLFSVTKDTFLDETSTAALVMPPQHPDQYSLDSVTRQFLEQNAPDGSTTMKNAEVNSKKKKKKRKRQKTTHNDVDSYVNLSGIPKDNFLPETSISTLDMLPQHQVQFSMDPAVRHSQEENEGNVQNLIEKVVDGSSAMTSEELYSRKENKRRKRQKTKCYDTKCDFNLSEVPKDTISPETYPIPLDTASQYPAPYLMDPVMRQCQQEENEGKEHNMIEKSIDRSSAMTKSRKKNDRRKRWKSGHNAIQSNSNFSGVTKDAISSETSTVLDVRSQQPAQLSLESVIRQSQEDNEGKEQNMLDKRSERSNGGHNQDDCSRLSHFSLGRSITSHSKKKLLVLDLNGLLADIVHGTHKGYKPYKMLYQKAVFKRPFCDDFLQFCFDRFHVGIWSSRSGKNVSTAISILVGKSSSRLLFSWCRTQCTKTTLHTIEDKDKPLVLKELRKLWVKFKYGWKGGEFYPHNTLLLDDSPYKALCNPMHTAIFPYPYKYNDANDTSLGPGGDLRVYLEGLAMADNVQEYVKSHPFGQPAITKSDPNWDFYQQVIDEVNKRRQPIKKKGKGKRNRRHYTSKANASRE